LLLFYGLSKRLQCAGFHIWWSFQSLVHPHLQSSLEIHTLEKSHWNEVHFVWYSKGYLHTTLRRDFNNRYALIQLNSYISTTGNTSLVPTLHPPLLTTKPDTRWAIAVIAQWALPRHKTRQDNVEVADAGTTVPLCPDLNYPFQKYNINYYLMRFLNDWIDWELSPGHSKLTYYPV